MLFTLLEYAAANSLFILQETGGDATKKKKRPPAGVRTPDLRLNGGDAHTTELREHRERVRVGKSIAIL